MQSNLRMSNKSSTFAAEFGETVDRWVTFYGKRYV